MTLKSTRRPVSAYLLAAGGGEAVSRFAQIVGMALAGRILGPDGLGTIALAWSLTVVAQGLVQGGPELVGIRLLTHREGDAPAQARIVADISRLKLSFAAASLPVLFALDLLLGHRSRSDMTQLALQSLSMTLISLNHGWSFRGLHRPLDQGWLRACQAILSLLLLWPLLLFWPSPQSAPIAESIAGVMTFIAGLRRLGRLLPRAGARSGMAPEIFKPALMLGFGGIVAAIQWMAPIFIAASCLGTAPLGILAAVLRLIQGLNGIFQIGLQAFYPLLSGLFADRSRWTGDAIISLSLQCGTVVLVLIVLLEASAAPLIGLLLGPNFAGAAGLFQALLPVLLPIALSSPLGYGLIAKGNSGVHTLIATLSGIAMVFGCWLSFIMLPDIKGALVLYPVLFGQLAGTLLMAHHAGLLTGLTPGWRSLLDPRKLGQLLRNQG